MANNTLLRESGAEGDSSELPLHVVMAALLLSLILSTLLGNTLLRWHQASELLSAHQAGSNGTWTAAEDCDASLNRTYAVSSSLISFYIPVAIMIVTYTRIFRIAQRQIRRISSLERAVERAQSCQSHDCPQDASLKNAFKKETKVLKTLSIIMGVFVFCWLPFFVLNCIVPFCDHPLPEQGGPPCVSEVVFNVFVWFGWANSSINPIIYAFNADFRRAFASILGCGRLCSSNAVETVNFSNELVSYHHDSTCQKDVATLSYPHLLPHTAALQGEDNELTFDKVSQISQASPHSSNTGVFSATVHMECETDLSLEKITPFTSQALD
ncbi:hypothetical protein lerEdw1_008787 [Lerista edwardsae]|nr:hypothetical protein lerEdw1_008787 [Lerista edwardsae]